MKKLFLTIIFISLAAKIFSQQVFEKAHTLSNFTWGTQVFEIPGWGYYIVGQNDSLATDSIGTFYGDINTSLIVRLNLNGDTLKTVEFFKDDTTLNGFAWTDFRTAVILDDGNILAIGASTHNNPVSVYDYDLWMCKFDLNLDTIWTKFFSIPDSAFVSYKTKATKISNGRFAFPGYQNSIYNGFLQCRLAVFDSIGNLIFNKTYPNTFPAILNGVAETADGGFLCTGYFTNTSSQLSSNPLILRLDSMGNKLWQDSLPFSQGYNTAQEIVKTQDGNFVFSWNHHYKGPGSPFHIYYYHATKIDDQGNQLWTKNYDYSVFSDFYVEELPNADLLFYGNITDTLGSGYQALLMRCDANGDTLWVRKIVGNLGSNSIPECFDASPTSDGGFILTGNTHCCNFIPNWGWCTSLWVLKVDSFGLITSTSDFTKNEIDVKLSNPFPNPSHDQFSISCIVPPFISQASFFIFDATGRQIKTVPLTIGFNQLVVDISNISAGVYSLAVSADGYNGGAKQLIIEN